ncbi:serine--tRNA ligase [Paremcibacter congregatus]|uniref:Serine--tRNA ligase n=1 Tax=Paremcibacter congregatus TaxID=2043170 RepID=A0A2G4YN04_9PROT|nr:serine--tRNA ligase [Paremcibacter congregatus]PHZ83687.1 serine--tRNA ligase [Paremcibacter congregatus]QDE27390.1 serine--tRNA ligase [Paremcibacter congregatus]
MFDIKAIRENPETFDLGWKRRGIAAQSEALIALDSSLREKKTELQECQSRRNVASKSIGQAKAKGEDADDLIREVADLKARMATLEEDVRSIEEELTQKLGRLDNIPAEDVPDGESEDDNLEVRKWGDIPAFDFAPKQHFDLGEDLGQMDFEGAARMSGARFVILRGDLAKLERALSAFMLDVHTTDFGYEEASVPLLVREQALYGTSQLPKFKEDLFEATTGHYMIPTGEVPLTNIVREDILEEEKLPLRFTALSQCFRSEAGSAGRDTRGMIRLHQFNKVEMVSITTPEQSWDELERMTGAAEQILQRLGLAYRVLTLCTGDMGFAARKTYDLEVWLPGQDAYREISSCSNTGDFQARRMNTRCRPAGEKRTRFVHTLNGSGLAVGRTLVAVLENYQQADGSIVIPEVLRPYMNGKEVISRP